MIAKADIRRVQEWMGHADVQTTMKYLHYEPRAEDARLVTEAFLPPPRLIRELGALPGGVDSSGRGSPPRRRTARPVPLSRYWVVPAESATS